MAETQTTNDLKGLYPDKSFKYSEAVPSALIVDPRIVTVAGVIEGDAPTIRVPYIKTDPTSGFVAEGAEIADGGGTLDEVLIATGKIATIVRQSNESASFESASQLIAAGVSRSIVTSADTAFLNNTGDGPKGILTDTGLIALEATVADNTALDAIADAKAKIGANGGTATALVMNHGTEAMFRKMKTSEGLVLLIDPTRGDALTLHGLPVIVNKAMPDNTILVASAAEIVAAVGDVKLTTSDQALFTYDSIIRRATWRIGAKAVHPDRLAKITITDGEGA